VLEFWRREYEAARFHHVLGERHCGGGAAYGARAAADKGAAHRRASRQWPRTHGAISRGAPRPCYAEGKNIQIEVRSAQTQVARLPELAAELVSSQVDVIVAIQTPAVYAAKNATHDIPIVMMAGDPIGTGLISNLARPGGNLTGLSGAAAELAAKSLELIPEMVPGARRVGVLGNANDPFMKPFLEDIQQAAPEVRLQVHQIIVRSSSELDGAFAAIARAQVDAVMIQGSLSDKLTVGLALKYQLPSLSTQKSAVQAGILMSYSANLTERGHDIARYVDKILKGTMPGDLPVQQPTRFELAINLKTAKALGLTVPPALLARADKVIE
jgi:putative tryptophan/tyrosine transport system substrate-binding protein